MKEIKLTQGKVALVDDRDYEALNCFKWYVTNPIKTRSYAVRSQQISPNVREKLRMHRVILQTPHGLLTDHINGNGLDNRRENLRIVTSSQNSMNRRLSKGNT